jgi:hypothetical protein
MREALFTKNLWNTMIQEIFSLVSARQKRTPHALVTSRFLGGNTELWILRKG